MTKRNILLVEDQNITAMDLAVRLERLGYSVLDTVDTGEEAVVTALELPVDCILMDIKLNSDMTGIDAAYEINKEMDVPIIYLTASTDEATLQETLKTEPYGFIHKPFNEYDLRYSIETALYKHDHDKKIKELNEILIAKNSELNSANEELQSTLEELEATNEELQATMEEMEASNEELRQTQEDLMKMEERYHQLFVNMSSGAAMYQAQDASNDFILFDINKAGEKILNVRKKNVEGISVSRIVIDDTGNSLVESLRRVKESGKPERLPVTRYSEKDLEHWLEFYIYRLPDGNIITVFDDITEQKQAEFDLIDSERRFRSLFEKAPLGMAMVNSNGKMLMCNQALEEILGYSHDELLKMSIKSITHKEDFSIDVDMFSKLLDGEIDGYSIEKRYVKKDGAVVWGHLSLSGVRDESGELVYAIGMVQDVSDLKKTKDVLQQRNEEAVRLSEEINAANEELESSNEELVATNEELEAANEELIRANEELYQAQIDLKNRVKELDCLFSISEITGNRERSLEELLQDAADIIPEAMRFDDLCCASVEYNSQMYKSCDFRKTKWRFEVPAAADDPQSVGVSVYYRKKPPAVEDTVFTEAEQDLVGEIALRIGSMIRTLKFEEELKTSEERYAMAQRATGIGTWEIGVKDRTVYLSGELAVLTGLGSDSFTGSLDDLYSVIHPDDRTFFKERIAEALQDRGDSEMEFRIVRPGGGTRWVRGTGDTVKDGSGFYEKIIGLALDITERKEWENALKKSETKFRTVFNSTNDAIVIHDMEGYILEFNRAACEYLGYTEDELRHMMIADVDVPEQAQYIEERMNDLKKNKTIRFESVHRHKDGNGVPVEVSSTTIEYYGIPAVLSIVRDITERKVAEESIRENENFLSEIFHSIRDGISVLDRNLSVLRVNRTMEELYAHRMPLVGSYCYSVYQERESLCPWCPSIKALETGEQQEETVPYPSEEEPTGWIRLTSHPLTSSTGEITGIIEIVRDITEKIKFEKAIIESENRFRNLFEASRDGIVIVEPDGTIVNCNKSFEQMTGYSLDELYAMTLFDLTPEKWHEFEQSEILKKQLFARGYSETYEKEYIRRDGTVYPVELNAYLLNEKDGKPELLWAMVRDISDRKQYEEKLKASIQEKEVLLKEIHHRVKNNMQVISSLLFLQSGYVENDRDRELFGECQNRVNSMAVVHEMLYRSDDFARINLKKLIRELAESIRNSSFVGPDRVTIEVRGENIYYGIDMAIPCAQIVNELISNSFKHAFPDGKKGKITVDVKKNRDGQTVIDYRDNGVGLPEDLQLDKSDTLGLKLVSELLKGLRGKVTITRKKGARFTFILP